MSKNKRVLKSAQSELGGKEDKKGWMGEGLSLFLSHLDQMMMLADCREDSLARILSLFQAQKRSTLYLPERESVIIELGWFIAGCSILFFRADHCGEDVLAHSLRLFQVRQETELWICAQEE